MLKSGPRVAVLFWGIFSRRSNWTRRTLVQVCCSNTIWLFFTTRFTILYMHWAYYFPGQAPNSSVRTLDLLEQTVLPWITDLHYFRSRFLFRLVHLQECSGGHTTGKTAYKKYAPMKCRPSLIFFINNLKSITMKFHIDLAYKPIHENCPMCPYINLKALSDVTVNSLAKIL